MSEDRIYEKLDSLERKSTDLLVGLARLEERVNDVPDLKTRVQSLERLKWVVVGGLATGGSSLGMQIAKLLGG